MFCTGCGSENVVVHRRVHNLCQFCADRLGHEMMIRLRAIREHGRYARDNRGPNYLAIFATPEAWHRDWLGRYRSKGTIGAGLYIATTPAEAYAEAQRIAIAKSWTLLRLDTQRTLVDLFRDPDYSRFFSSEKPPLEFDEDRYGRVPLFPSPQRPDCKVD